MIEKFRVDKFMFTSKETGHVKSKLFPSPVIHTIDVSTTPATIVCPTCNHTVTLDANKRACNCGLRWSISPHEEMVTVEGEVKHDN